MFEINIPEEKKSVRDIKFSLWISGKISEVALYKEGGGDDYRSIIIEPSEELLSHIKREIFEKLNISEVKNDR
jgi:hypothetical protein